MKRILSPTEARKSLLSGLEQVSSIVSETLGPGGRVILLSGRHQRLSKDGVSVAGSIELEGAEGEGAKLAIAIASAAVTQVGDGTTTATLLGYELAKWALDQQSPPRHVQESLMVEGERVIQFIHSQARQIEIEEPLLERIAAISGNSDEVGGLVADAWKKIGKTGIITHVLGSKTGVTVEPGYRVESGLFLPQFVNDALTASFVGEDVQIVLIEPQVKHGQHLLALLMKLNPKRPILLIADLEGDALGTAAANVTQGKLNMGLIRVPGIAKARRSYLDDLAALTGASVIDTSYLTIGDAPRTCFGRANSVRSNQWNTTLLTDPCPQDHLSQLQASMDSCPDYMKDVLSERIAKLSSGVAVITCGGATEAEQLELRDRVDDAIRASRAALEQGVVPGAGWCLANAGSIPPFSSPQNRILENAGYPNANPAQVIDARNGKVVDPFEAGIVDPLPAVVTAVEAAISIAKLIVNCGGMVLEVPPPH